MGSNPRATLHQPEKSTIKLNISYFAYLTCVPPVPMGFENCIFSELTIFIRDSSKLILTHLTGGNFITLWSIYLTSITNCPSYTKGDIWGYPIMQYHKKNWQIPKYSIKIQILLYIYDQSRLLKVVSISCVWLSQAHTGVCTSNQPQPLQENARRPRILDYS